MSAKRGTCQNFATGSAVPEPEDLRSQNGELTVDLIIHNYVEANGAVRYCYTTKDGKEAPNLRLNPGDLLILNLRNSLTDTGKAASGHSAHKNANANGDPGTSGQPCLWRKGPLVTHHPVEFPGTETPSAVS